MTNHVEILQAGRTTAVPKGVTMLEAALAYGIVYPYGCRSGRCGSCMARGLRPEDLHVDVFFTPREASARGSAPAFRIDDSPRRDE